MQKIFARPRASLNAVLKPTLIAAPALSTRQVSKAARNDDSWIQKLLERNKLHLRRHDKLHGEYLAQNGTGGYKAYIAAMRKRQMVESVSADQVQAGEAGYGKRLDGGPLRILYCGSEEWSAGILKHLCKWMRKQDPPIQSIDVLYKRPRSVYNKKFVHEGRTMMAEEDVPVRQVALEHGLRAQGIESFDNYRLPVDDAGDNKPNFIITAAFSLAFPQRLIDEATYGGVNIHPGALIPVPGDKYLSWRDKEAITYNALADPKPPFDAMVASRIEESGTAMQILVADDYTKGKVLRQWTMKVTTVKRERLKIRKKFILHSANMIREQLRSNIHKSIKTAPPVIADSPADVAAENRVY